MNTADGEVHSDTFSRHIRCDLQFHGLLTGSVEHLFDPCGSFAIRKFTTRNNPAVVFIAIRNDSSSGNSLASGDVYSSKISSHLYVRVDFWTL